MFNPKLSVWTPLGSAEVVDAHEAFVVSVEIVHRGSPGQIARHFRV
ncbi:MAG: hypothetical protein O7E57_13000 [Gammaproteobacteria bacterium]|nr:hypothetical protein [Gammaproteobacteria bacterium]